MSAIRPSSLDSQQETPVIVLQTKTEMLYVAQKIISFVGLAAAATYNPWITIFGGITGVVFYPSAGKTIDLIKKESDLQGDLLGYCLMNTLMMVVTIAGSRLEGNHIPRLGTFWLGFFAVNGIASKTSQSLLGTQNLSDSSNIL